MAWRYGRENLYLQVAECGTPEVLILSGFVTLHFAVIFRLDVNGFFDGRRRQSGSSAEIDVAHCERKNIKEHDESNGSETWYSNCTRKKLSRSKG